MTLCRAVNASRRFEGFFFFGALNRQGGETKMVQTFSRQSPPTLRHIPRHRHITVIHDSRLVRDEEGHSDHLTG